MQVTCYRLFAAFMVSVSGTAQAVLNIEPLRQNTDQMGVYGSASASVSGQSGNSRISRFSAEGHVGYKATQSDHFLIVSAHYGKSGQQRNVNNYQIHLRRVQALNTTWFAEAFIQRAADDFRRLSRRDLVGAGGRFGQRENKNQHRFIGVGAFYEEEHLTDQSADSVLRFSSYLDIKQALTPQLLLSSVSYWQPVASDFQDFRFLQQGKLEFTLSEKLSFYLKLDINHDHQPPAGVEKTDIKYANGLTYRF